MEKQTVLMMHDLVKDGKVMGTLRIYLEGSGNDSDDHEIVAVSVDGAMFGKLEAQYAKDLKVVDGGEIKLGA